MAKKYVKKPVVIEAIQWDGKNLNEVTSFVGNDDFTIEKKGNGVCEIVIHTLEGKLRASVNDYIIKGIKGEYYPCKPNIFIETYEEAKDGEE